jgi:lipopolysaccharide transport system permease protein
MLPWTMFSSSMGQSAISLVSAANLLRKIYFPRLIIPVSTVLTALVDFLIASSVLVVLMIVYSSYPEPIRLLALPGLILLALAAALGVGLWLSALNVTYRDVAFLVPFLTQIWLLLTPAVYSKPVHSDTYRTIVALNPMQGVILGFRWAFLAAAPAPGYSLLISAATIALLLATGSVYFRRTERTFADVV